MGRGPPAPVAAGAEPELRIGLLVGVGSVVIGAQGATAAVQGGTPTFRLADGDRITLAPDGRGVAVSGRHQGRYEHLAFASLRRARYVTVDGRPYRGVVEVLVRNGGLTVINAVPLEAYLRGVVNAEMGGRVRAERHALAAQAVVSRTYALANRGRFGAEGYDLRAGVGDQVYGGVERETDEGEWAVRETAGIVLAYRGELVAPFFHSTCGGSTADPEEVFRTVADRPYLRAVSDARPGGGSYCDRSPRYAWRVEWDGPTLRDILRRTLPTAVGIDGDVARELRDVYVRRTGRSGRATDLRVVVAGGAVPVPGHAIRQVLERPDGGGLGGTLIAVRAERTDELLTKLIVDGHGWGHGVGLCQWGAVGRARAGQDYRMILTTYFPGVELVRWY